MRNVIPAQNRLPVKNHTTSARSTAGMSMMSSRMTMMIIIPIMTRMTRAIMSIWGIESKIPKTARINRKSSLIIMLPKKVNSC